MAHLFRLIVFLLLITVRPLYAACGAEQSMAKCTASQMGACNDTLAQAQRTGRVCGARFARSAPVDGIIQVELFVQFAYCGTASYPLSRPGATFDSAVDPTAVNTPEIPLPTCDRNCEIKWVDTNRCYSTPVSGTIERINCEWQVAPTGAYCDVNPVPTTDPIKCPDGKVLGDINGTPACVPAGTPQPSSPPGSGTTPSTTTPTGTPPTGTTPAGTTPAGTTTTTTGGASSSSSGGTGSSPSGSVTNPGAGNGDLNSGTSGTGTTGTGTSTGTGSSPSGGTSGTGSTGTGSGSGSTGGTSGTGTTGGTSGTGTGTGTSTGKDKPADDLCTAHPDLQICKNSTWAGGCKSFSCDGDAIQCAIAKEIHNRNCKLYDEPTDEQKKYEEEIKKGSDKVLERLGLTSDRDVGSGDIDQSDALGGGSCVTDLSITVYGHGVSLPFSQLCGSLAALGNILVGVSLLIAGRIVIRG